MARVYADRVMETTTTTGTGTLTLAGAVTANQTFAAVGDGNACYACAFAVDNAGVETGDWEAFEGTYTSSGTTLSRTTVLASSNGGAAVNFGAGAKRVMLVIPAAVARSVTTLAVPSQGPAFGGSRYVGGTVNTLASGTTDLYTCPSGKIALMSGSPVGYNPTGGTVTVEGKLKSGGGYYRVASSAMSLAAGSSGTNNVLAAFAAGESLAATASAGGTILTWRVCEIDATGLVVARLLSLSAGDNTIYTCPAGKVAYLLGTTAIASSTASILLSNDSGSSRTCHIKLNATQVTPAVTVSNGSVSGPSLHAALTAGETLAVNTDAATATQSAHALFLEVDA